MPKLDRVRMTADIATVWAEYPHLEDILIEALYGHFMECEERQPELAEFREYVRHATSSLPEWQLWEMVVGPGTPSEEPPPIPARNPRRGRPKGSRSSSRQGIVDTYRSLRASYGRAPTQRELASNLDPPIARRTLQQHLREYGLPWPPE
jgi:hypothetical protein